MFQPSGQGDESSSSQRSLWLSKKFRGAAYNSFRSAKAAQPTEKSSTAHTTEDEIDKMKKRADKNNMFVYINITSVPFIVSYKVRTLFLNKFTEFALLNVKF